MQQLRGYLSEGIIHLIANTRLIITGKAPMATMANYAHHQDRAAHGGNPNALANCILCAKGMLGEIVVNDDHGFAADTIVLIEKANFAQRNVHNFQVIRRYAGRQRDGLLIRWRRSGRGPVREGVFSYAHGDNVGQRRRLYAGDAASTIEHILPGLANLFGILEYGGREREVRGDYVVHVETGIERREREQRVAEHPGRDQQDYREGDLRDYKCAVQAARTSGNAARPCAEGLFNVVHGHPQSRRQPEKNTTDERGDHGENKHAPVQMDLFCARQVAGPKRDKGINAEQCEYYAKQASTKT